MTEPCGTCGQSKITTTTAQTILGLCGECGMAILPRVEAGGRALETARKIRGMFGDGDNCAICKATVAQIAALIQFAMNAETTLLKKIAETVDLLPSITGISPVKDRYQDIPMAIRELQQAYQDASRARNGEAGPLLRRQAAQHKAELAAMNAQERELREALGAALSSAKGALILDAMVDDSGKPYGTTTAALEAIAEAERLLAERGEKV